MDKEKGLGITMVSRLRGMDATPPGVFPQYLPAERVATRPAAADGAAAAREPRLLDRLRHAIRLRHYSRRTEAEGE